MKVLPAEHLAIWTSRQLPCPRAPRRVWGRRSSLTHNILRHRSASTGRCAAQEVWRGLTGCFQNNCPSGRSLASHRVQSQCISLEKPGCGIPKMHRRKQLFRASVTWQGIIRATSSRMKDANSVQDSMGRTLCRRTSLHIGTTWMYSFKHICLKFRSSKFFFAAIRYWQGFMRDTHISRRAACLQNSGIVFMTPPVATVEERTSAPLTFQTSVSEMKCLNFFSEGIFYLTLTVHLWHWFYWWSSGRGRVHSL